MSIHKCRNTIGKQHVTTINAANAVITQLLDFMATYLDDGIVYHSNDMVLTVHADAIFHNASKGRSRTGAHTVFAEDYPFQRWNGAILTIAKIIKFVMTSAAEAELGALFTTAQKTVALRNTLIEMGWPQPPSPIQTDNTTAEGVVNGSIVS